MAIDFDVAIAGAGPAGAALAKRLVNGDPAWARRIVLIDRARFPRSKPCGGGLTGHAALAMRELGFALTVPHVACAAACIQAAGAERRVVLAEPVNVVRREELDASLLAQVRALGVTVREDEGVLDFRRLPEGVEVKTAKGTIRARVLAGADGAASVVRKRLLGRGARPLRLFRAVIEAPPAWHGRAEMIYDFSPMSWGLRGYLWLFPMPGDKLNVGVMHAPSGSLFGSTRRDPARLRDGHPTTQRDPAEPGREPARLRHGQSEPELTEILRRGLLRWGIELPEQAAKGWPAWPYASSAPLGQDRVLLVGDAAGIDALTGEGIAVAMEQAIIAADAITHAFRSGDFSFATYARTVRSATVGRELALDAWLARLLYGSSAWKLWLSFVLYDRELIDMVAERVSGSLVLVDHKTRMCWRLFRHLFSAVPRYQRLQRALAASGHAGARIFADPRLG